MTRFLFLLVIYIVPFAGFSQESLSSRLRNQFDGCESCKMVSIKKLMFDLFLKVDAEIDPQAKEVLSNLNEILILELVPEELGGFMELNQKIKKLLPVKEYEEILKIKDGTQDIQFLVKRKENIIAELLLYILEEHKVSLICLDGDLNLDNIGSLSESMNLPGFDKLDKIDN